MSDAGTTVPVPGGDASRPGLVRASERRGRAPEGLRWHTDFDWEFVDTALLHDLLMAAGPKGEIEIDRVREQLLESDDGDLEREELDRLEKDVYVVAAR